MQLKQTLTPKSSFPQIAAWASAIITLCEAGGPEPEQYPELLAQFTQIHAMHGAGEIGDDDITTLRNAFDPAIGIGTLQGRAWLKTHGNAGDFQIIDDIYTTHTSTNPQLRRWDEFFHAGVPAQAVRNRKDYFKQMLIERLALWRKNGDSSNGKVFRVLNVASGPCRDVAEFFEENPGAPVHVTCVDQDANAIAHAQRLCEPCKSHVSFVKANALKRSTPERFDLMWSAGLFDYFSDDWFVTALKRFARLAKPGGYVVVGNFGLANPGRAYMEFVGEWFLHHRSPEQLVALVERASADKLSHVTVDSESLELNLFLIAMVHDH